MKIPFPLLALAVCALTLLTCPVVAQEPAYQLGRGTALADWLTAGGYFSTEYSDSDRERRLSADDLALLLYGENGKGFSYLMELESVEPYVADLKHDTTTTNFPPTIERLYLDYKFSDLVSVRIGKQITPIGYWNLQPINVLRETTSNPLYSDRMLPKFLTGVDLYGYIPWANDLTYHAFAQNSRDMDQSNINIAIDRHYGASLEKVLPGGWKVGASLGRFQELNSGSTRYLQMNTRFDTDRFTLLAEGSHKLQDQKSGGSTHADAFYVQGEYHFTTQHALIARAEYMHDTRMNQTDRIGIVGYSYRPVFPVSLKIEHQWHQDPVLNRVMASLSVLF